MSSNLGKTLLLLFLIASQIFLPSRESLAQEATPIESQVVGGQVQEFFSEYCLECHTSPRPAAAFDLDEFSARPLRDNLEHWESIVRKLRARQMPPAEALRPEESEYVSMLRHLEQALERISTRFPAPGRTDTIRRLTRFEYQNAVRDLLDLEIDASKLLPAEEVSHGFDNITVGELSPTLINRYLSAAQKISRLALGTPSNSPPSRTVRIKPDLTQEQHVEGLPLGTRGGALIRHNFPTAGMYEVRVVLARDRNEHVEGLREAHEMEILLDKNSLKRFTVKPPRGQGGKQAQSDWERPTHANVDRHLVLRFHANAGPHNLGVTFLKEPSSLLETKRQPWNVSFNMYRHPRIGPAVFQVSITGPLHEGQVNASQADESPSRRKILTSRPANVVEEEACARDILTQLMTRAFRGQFEASDLTRPMRLFREARADGSFEDGIELALGSILVHPKFLFRVERQPAEWISGQAYRLTDVELASRLSFFLWSSIPDDELLELAAQRKLSNPEVLKQQTERMLRDKKSKALVTNFAGQWLYLRNLESITPDARLFPEFDDNLRRAMRRETELFFESILRQDASVLAFLDADYTFLNERLAKHYGIPHVFGSHFRRVSLPESSRRGGLLRQGSILTVTSYATRTSPVIRGKWLLENLMGTPPPPPPPDVPALDENEVAQALPLRERLARHRADPACASCHNLIDPPGFALENYDAVGRWRDRDGDLRVDADGGLPDGSTFTGVDGLERGLLERPELFVGTLVEKLMTYGVGRGLEHTDGPLVRRIVQEAAQDDYRFFSLILGIVRSPAFQMRASK